MSGRHAVGIVGAGMIAETLHLPVLTSMPNVRVEWIADLDARRARSLGAAYGVRDVPLPTDPADLPPCDAVLLATPLGVRRPYFEAFSARGTAVMAEKPFAVSAEEHREILTWFAPHRVACGYQRRTFANTRLIRRLFQEGWLGRPREIVMREGDRVKRSGADAPHFDDLALAGGGVLISLGCHSLDWAVHVTGATAYEILEEEMIFDGRLDRKVSARIRLESDSGPVDLDYCVSWLDAQPNRAVLGFENAQISVEIGAGATIEVRGGDGAPAASLIPRVEGAVTQNQAFFLEWSGFLEGLETGTLSVVAASDTLLTTEIIEDIYRSARGE